MFAGLLFYAYRPMFGIHLVRVLVFETITKGVHSAFKTLCPVRAGGKN